MVNATLQAESIDLDLVKLEFEFWLIHDGIEQLNPHVIGHVIQLP